MQKKMLFQIVWTQAIYWFNVFLDMYSCFSQIPRKVATLNVMVPSHNTEKTWRDEASNEIIFSHAFCNHTLLLCFVFSPKRFHRLSGLEAGHSSSCALSHAFTSIRFYLPRFITQPISSFYQNSRVFHPSSMNAMDVATLANVLITTGFSTTEVKRALLFLLLLRVRELQSTDYFQKVKQGKQCRILLLNGDCGEWSGHFYVD